MSDRMAFRLFAVVSAAALLASGMTAFFLIGEGFPMLLAGGWNELFGVRWAPADIPPAFGMLPFLAGTVWAAVCTLVMAVPLALLSAVYLCWFAPVWLVRPFTCMVDLMAGIPAVLYGLWGASVLVPAAEKWLGGSGESIAASSVVMALMVIPTILAVTVTAFRGVPRSYYTGARALGISHEETVLRIMIPPAVPGILAAVVLACGRVMGETMIVVMTMGNQTWIPLSWLEGGRTLSGNLFIEMAYSSNETGIALIAEGLVLMVMVFCMSAAFFWFRRRTI